MDKCEIMTCFAHTLLHVVPRPCDFDIGFHHVILWDIIDHEYMSKQHIPF